MNLNTARTRRIVWMAVALAVALPMAATAASWPAVFDIDRSGPATAPQKVGSPQDVADRARSMGVEAACSEPAVESHDEASSLACEAAQRADGRIGRAVEEVRCATSPSVRHTPTMARPPSLDEAWPGCGKAPTGPDVDTEPRVHKACTVVQHVQSGVNDRVGPMLEKGQTGGGLDDDFNCPQPKPVEAPGLM